MAKYIKQLLGAFNNNNHTIVKRVSKLFPEHYTTLTVNPNGDTLICTNKSPGLYKVTLNSIDYAFILPVTIAGDDVLIIKNEYEVYYIIGDIKKYITLYQLDTNASSFYNIENTVNTILDGIVLSGKSTIKYADGKSTQSPYNPAELTSIDSFNIKSTLINDTAKTNTLNIKFKNNIKSLPSGDKDLFIMDSVHQDAYALFKVGRMILTGNEPWEYAETSKDYCTFFFQYDQISCIDNDVSVSCNYFPTITCNKMNSDSTLTYAISNSNNVNKSGIYVRIPIDVIGKSDLKVFKKYLQDKVKENPIVVEYLLKDTYRYKSVLLDEYCIEQYNGTVKLEIDVDTNFGYFSKVLH